MNIRHTLHALPPRMRGRADAIDGALRGFLADLAAAVDRGATQNLSGGGAAGSYPVPRRTGNLARQQGHTVGRRQAVVWNAAPYARAVHEGFHAFGNPNAPYYGPRRYLTDAADQANPIERLQQALVRVQ